MTNIFKTNFENANEGGELEELPAIHVKQEDDGIILETYKQYQVVELPDKALIPEGYKKSSVLIEGETIPIYKDPENGYDFVLIYLKELSGHSNLAKMVGYNFIDTDIIFLLIVYLFK